MKTALITDVHANAEALQAVLADARARGAGAFAFLGDFVGYGADPAAVVDTVRALAAAGAVVVRGNHDEAVVQGPSEHMHPDARAVVAWTRAQLNDAQLAFLAALPLTATRDTWLYVHANAWDPPRWGYVEGRMEAVRSLHATTARYTVVGHVHEPRLYHLSGTGKAGEFIPIPDMPVPLPPHRQWLIVPGAAGQPRDGNPAACYAMHDDALQAVAWHRVPYDHDAAAAKVRAAGLPEALATRLVRGE